MRTHHLLAIALAGVLPAACGGREPAKPAATGAPAAAAAPAAPPKVRVYVTNEWSGDLTVINADTQTAIGVLSRGASAVAPGRAISVHASIARIVYR